MLATTLTEPVWPLFLIGLLGGYWKLFKGGRHRKASLQVETPVETWQSLRSDLDASAVRHKLVSLTLLLFWFALLLAYVLLRQPAMYDGLRHFLFILPPIFIFIGLGFDFLFDRIASYWLRAGLVLLLMAPGVAGIIQLHPYEYTYYNSFIGGTSRAFRNYETDYWLTCYKEAVQTLNQATEGPTTLYVHREPYIAAYYAGKNVTVQDLRGALGDVKSGDIALVNTRTNEDRKVFKDAPILLKVARGNAIFCMMKQIP